MPLAASHPPRIACTLARASLVGFTLLGNAALLAQGSFATRPSYSNARALGALHGPQSGALCDTSWSVPRELHTRDGLRIYVEGPSTLVTPQGLMLVGSPTIGWMTHTNFIDTLAQSRPIDPSNMVGVIIDARGAAVPLPKLQFSGRPSTILAARDRGDVRIVWATASDTAAGSFNLDSLWTSTLHDGAWTSPRSLVQGQRIRWFANTATLAEMIGQPLAVMPMQDTTKSPWGGLLLLRRSGDEWTRRWIATGVAPPMGASVLSTTSESFVIALTGEVLVGADTSTNAVFVMRVGWSKDSSGSSTRILRRVGIKSAVEPKLFRLGSTLHLMWMERPRNHMGADLLFEATSTNDGVSWTEPTSISLPAEYRGLSVVATGEQTAFAALVSDDEHTATVLVRRPSGWKIEYTLTGVAFTAPTLTLIDGKLLLTFGSGTTSPEVQATVPFLMVATRPLQCEGIVPTHR
jgi:hypothetical protein